MELLTPNTHTRLNAGCHVCFETGKYVLLKAPVRHRSPEGKIVARRCFVSAALTTGAQLVVRSKAVPNGMAFLQCGNTSL